jgi:hypothetical protein
MEIGEIIANIPFDYFALAAIFVVLFLFSLYGGSAQGAALVLTVSITLFLWTMLTEAAWIGQSIANLIAMGTMAQLAVFGLLAACMYLVLRRILGFSMESGGLPIPAAMSAASALILLLVAWYVLPGTAEVWDFGDRIDALFVPAFLFWWMLGAFVLLIFTRRGW